jgi:hypothetical protein
MACLVDLEEHAHVGEICAIRFTVAPITNIHITHRILILSFVIIATDLCVIDWCLVF